jgi:hypothetical protein
MAKYLILWEMDESRIPDDPKERAAGWKALLDMVKKDMADGVLTDWGGCIGQTNGYSIFEGTELELSTRLQQYVPYVQFIVNPVGSVEHSEQMFAALAK